MFSEEFAILSTEHEADAELVRRLAEYISAAVARPNQIIDERIVAATLHAPADLVERLLIELVALDVIDTVFLWVCPNAGGTAWAGSEIEEAPSSVRCADCLQVHYLDEDDVDVHFRPSAT